MQMTELKVTDTVYLNGLAAEEYDSYEKLYYQPKL